MSKVWSLFQKVSQIKKEKKPNLNYWYQCIYSTQEIQGMTILKKVQRIVKRSSSSSTLHVWTNDEFIKIMSFSLVMCEDQDCIFFNGIPTRKNMKVRGLLWFLQGCRDQDGPHKTTKDKYLYLDKSIKKNWNSLLWTWARDNPWRRERRRGWWWRWGRKETFQESHGIIPSNLIPKHIIIFYMLDIVEQCASTMVWALLLFLLCWTYKINN